MLTQSVSIDVLGAPSEEVISSIVEGTSAGVRQAIRGVYLGLIGFGVVLSIAAILIGATEMGIGGAGPSLPPGQILHR